MPIASTHQPPDASPAAIAANQRGVFLRSHGRLSEAAVAFREAIAAQPDLGSLHANLATVLVDCGDIDGAQREYETALACDPRLPAALAGLGSLHVRLGRFAQARACYDRVLRQDPNDMAAHLAMYEIEQIDGNIPKALKHQHDVLVHKSLFSQYAPQEERRLLALVVPGDWQANVPVDFLVDPRTTTLHKLYVISREQAQSAAIPQADAVFIAIGESDEAAASLTLAGELAERIGLPVINDANKIPATNRVQLAHKLHSLADVNAPATARVQRSSLASESPQLDFPIVIRPVGSHAGRGLSRVNGASELQAYLAQVAAETFYVMPFVDFRAPDGYYRKYRIIVVDGVPYPYHLAISTEWMIHYYNAPMRETAWMREEEAFFLAHFESVFREPLRRSLGEIANVLELEYFGIDCSIDAQGRLLVFEADPAMIVHAGDDPQMFAYKTPHVQRIFDAFQRLIDRVRSR